FSRSGGIELGWTVGSLAGSIVRYRKTKAAVPGGNGDCRFLLNHQTIELSSTEGFLNHIRDYKGL
ncbi:MAG: hypothetical protein ACRBG0_10485, partial [Lewinella sp.]|uniref:hypothetical protein n=1 Tax=Lewinella sp. TaxID=2004506 RepID=UPI003D6AF6D5